MTSASILTNDNRIILAQSFNKTHDETNWLLKLVEVIVWGGAGLMVGWGWGLLFGAVAFFIVSKRPQLITMRFIASNIGRPFIALFATVIIFLCYAITASSFTIVLLHGYVLIKEQSFKANPSIQAAARKVSEAQTQLETLQKQNAHISQSEIDLAVMNEGKLKLELEQAKKQAHKSWEQAHKQWELKKTQFWAQPHPSGISNRQVMTNNCSPKKSPYGGGWMRSAAASLCPDWQALQSREPKLSDDQHIQSIQSQIEKLRPVLNVSDNLQSASQIITVSLQNQANLRKQLRGGFNYENGLELFISVAKKLSKHINVELFVFLLVGGVVIILLGITALSRMIGDAVHFSDTIPNENKPLSSVINALRDGVSKSIYSSVPVTSQPINAPNTQHTQGVQSTSEPMHTGQHAQYEQHTQGVPNILEPIHTGQHVQHEQHTQGVQPVSQPINTPQHGHTQSVQVASQPINTPQHGHTQGVQVVSQPMNTNPHSHHDYKQRLFGIYERIAGDVQTGVCTNLSFNSLGKQYNLNRQDASFVREWIVENYIAVRDSTNKLVIVNKPVAN